MKKKRYALLNKTRDPGAKSLSWEISAITPTQRVDFIQQSFIQFNTNILASVMSVVAVTTISNRNDLMHDNIPNCSIIAALNKNNSSYGRVPMIQVLFIVQF